MKPSRSCCAQIEANHAGGYQYRLAKKSANLTEAEFQKMPLAFVGKQGLRWDGGPEHGGTEIFFEGVYATEGTLPKGSAYALSSLWHARPAGLSKRIMSSWKKIRT